jgi:cytoskeletal protein RodZ
MLGLDQPAVNQESPNHPSVDSLRERSFSGLDSFFEPEQPKNSGGRILLLVALLAALGVAGWWTYTNYLGATQSHKPEAATASTVEPPVEAPSPKPATNAGVAPDAGTPPAATPPAAVPEGPSENAGAAPDAAAKTAPAAKPTAPAPATKIVAKREIPATSPKTAPAVAPDSSDADFRQAEAYLYGRGGRENCDEAVKLLKAASAKSNAKARSAFGTMYATGHCVPRDLPTSYLWFALALKVDPNNQILEKDLSAVWNQMTPPERQQATRMKQ